jgi:hypothetical protein
MTRPGKLLSWVDNRRRTLSLSTGGLRPILPFNRHDSVHIFGAICPARGMGAAIIMPGVNTEAMNEHLKEISC